MISDTILHKYLRHLRYIDQGSIVHLDAVNLAFRLALEELEESMAPATATAELGAANLRIMELQADLERLQTAANAEVAELRQQIAQMDADNAALICRNKELADELKQTRLDYLEAGFYEERATPTNGNGTAITIKPAPAASLTMWNNPELLDSLDQETADWWIGVSSGRHQWRTVPKPVQLSMVREVMAASATPGAMTMREFDAIKPSWMPSANSHTQTLRLSWAQLNDWSVEL